MSHVSSISAAIFDVFVLTKALKELEIEYKQGGEVKSSCGGTEKVDLVIKTPDKKEIGLKENEDGSYDFVMEAEEIPKQSKFMNVIKQKYSYLKVMDELQQKGYHLDKEENTPDKSIKLKFSKWD